MSSTGWLRSFVVSWGYSALLNFLKEYGEPSLGFRGGEAMLSLGLRQYYSPYSCPTVRFLFNVGQPRCCRRVSTVHALHAPQPGAVLDRSMAPLGEPLELPLLRTSRQAQPDH